MALTFEDYRKHIDQVVADSGQWLGILDENGWPILDLPPVVSLTASETRLSAESVDCVIPLSGGAGRAVAEELLAQDITDVDSSGQLIQGDTPARFLCAVRPGERRTYFLANPQAEGVATPSQATLSGVELLDGLAAWPCPSIPSLWKQRNFSTWTTDASGQTYKTPRELAQIEVANKADGYTEKGKARTVIRELIQDSLDAVNDIMGWNDPHMVVDFGGGVDTSKTVVIRTDDSSIWDTVAEPAKNAGVGIQVDLWWPGDPAVTVREGDKTVSKAWERPMQVCRVETIKGA